MAKKVTVALVDDYDPQFEATETLTFGLDNVTYEIDLCDDNAAALRGDMEKWVEVARRVHGARRTRSANPAAGGGLPLAEIRDWAKAEGLAVSDRGRVSAEIVRAWNNRDHKPAEKAPAKKAAAKSPVTKETVLAGAVAAGEADPAFSDNKVN